MHPRRPRRVGFDELLDRLIDDARFLRDTYVKLNDLRDLNVEAILLDQEMHEDPDFVKLTLGAPRVDRDDPLGLQRRDREQST